ncbi:MAG: 50S ribosomal protein L32 [Phycisphaerae bacterium]|nr:50S ribosomal protein L32 [Phycisphaerae bacterium]
MLPQGRTSKMRKGTRRSHHALRAPNLVACPKCGQAKLPHAACANCGYASAKVALPPESEES